MSRRYYVKKEDDEYQIIDTRSKMVIGRAYDEKCNVELCEILNAYHQELEQSNIVLKNYLEELKELKKEIQEKKELFKGADKDHYNSWVDEIKKYIDEDNDEFIIKLALSYTLQALRNGESLKKFQWDYIEEDTKYIYEVWYDYFDGTQANLSGYQKKIESYLNENKARNRIDELNGEPDKTYPYYLKKVEVGERK